MTAVHRQTGTFRPRQPVRDRTSLEIRTAVHDRIVGLKCALTPPPLEMAALVADFQIVQYAYAGEQCFHPH